MMSNPVPLTDEELASIEEALDDDDAETPGSEVVRYVSRSEVRRLIAALRASRAELAVMTADRDSWERMYAIAKARADKAEAER